MTLPLPDDPDVSVDSYDSRREWLLARRGVVGGSDSSGILGASAWSSPMKVWADKCGPFIEEDGEPEWLFWGRMQERTIMDGFARKTGRRILSLEDCGASPHTLIRRGKTFGYSPDGFQFRQDRHDPGLWEAKNTSRPDLWAEGPPLEYQIQVQHGLGVTGLKWGSIAVLINGSRSALWDIERNDTFIAKLRRACERFWRHVADETPPPPTGLDTDTLSRLFPEEIPGSVIRLEPSTMTSLDGRSFMVDPEDLVARRASLQALQNRVEKEIDATDAYLKALLGNAERGILPGGSYVSWKTVAGHDRPAVHVPASRRFTVFIPKAEKKAFSSFSDLTQLPPLATRVKE